MERQPKIVLKSDSGIRSSKWVASPGGDAKGMWQSAEMEGLPVVLCFGHNMQPERKYLRK